MSQQNDVLDLPPPRQLQHQLPLVPFSGGFGRRGGGTIPGRETGQDEPKEPK